MAGEEDNVEADYLFSVSINSNDNRARVDGSGVVGYFWEAIRRRREESIEIIRNKWKAIFFGQLIAFIAACVNASSFSLESKFGVVTPMFQMCIVYFLLSIQIWFRSTSTTLSLPSRRGNGDDNGNGSEVYISLGDNSDHVRTRSRNTSATSTSTYSYRIPLLGIRLRVPWWIYFFISILDLGAGFMTLRALQYSSLTSATLLGSLCIPSTMLFSRYLLDKSFLPHHYVGVCFCVVGGSITILADFDFSSLSFFPDSETTAEAATPKPSHPHSYFGDMLACGAAIMYGLGDSVAEYSIKHVDRTEYLGMLGFFGFIVAGVLLPFFKNEIQTLSDLLAQPLVHTQAIAIMVSYILFLVSYYIMIAFFLESSDATLLNLSLQAANLWTTIFSIVACYDPPTPFFYLALLLVVCGVVFYEMASPTATDNIIAATNSPSFTTTTSTSTTSSSSDDGRSILSHSSTNQILNYSSLEESR